MIRSRIKSMMIPRYKVICLVHIGELGNHAVRIASQCLWDSSVDTFAMYEFKNNSLFAVATVYGVYAEWFNVCWQRQSDVITLLHFGIKLAFLCDTLSELAKLSQFFTWSLHSHIIYSTVLCRYRKLALYLWLLFTLPFFVLSLVTGWHRKVTFATTVIVVFIDDFNGDFCQKEPNVKLGLI